MAFVQLKITGLPAKMRWLLAGLFMTVTLGGCWSPGWSDCVANCSRAPDTGDPRNPSDCNKRCHVAHSGE